MTLLEILEWSLTALVGVVSGAYGVLVGAGGGFILSPVLLIISDSGPETIAGTVLTAVAVNSILVAWTYRSMKVVDYRSGLLFAAAAVPGAVVGAFVVGEVAPAYSELCLVSCSSCSRSSLPCGPGCLTTSRPSSPST